METPTVGKGAPLPLRLTLRAIQPRANKHFLILLLGILYGLCYIVNMKNTKAEKDGEESVLLDALRSCGPVARGCLSQVRMKCARSGCGACKSGKGHPAWIFAYRVGGRRKCLYVRRRDVPAVEAALERGRRLESLLLAEGVRLIESLRAEADAD